MGAIITLLATAAPMLVRLVAPQLTDIVDAYARKEITAEEMHAKISEALTGAATKIEESHADTLAKTFDSFMSAASKSRIMQIGWAATLFSQLWVLFWYQWIVPFGAFAGWWGNYPSPGETLVWAYALIGGCIGLGPVVLRAGPAAAGGILNKLRGLVGR